MAEGGGEGFDDLEMKNLNKYDDASNEQLEEELTDTEQRLSETTIEYYYY